MGQFIYLYEVATSYIGALMEINAYDQPAVQLGKLATFAQMGRKDPASVDLAGKIRPVVARDSKFML